MSVSDYDVNPANSELNIGIEIEFPEAHSQNELLKNKGHDSSGLAHQVRSSGMATWNTHPGSDPSVGLEVVSTDPLDLEDAEEWYTAVVDEIEHRYDTIYQPTGDIHGNTAGTHIHISDLSNDQARRLYEISQTEWAKVFFCSSVTEDDNGSPYVPVFRGGRFCEDSGFTTESVSRGANRYSMVNNRGGGHWEWRLPEPMTRRHFRMVVEFLRLFEQNPDAAVEYARQRLEEGDSCITSISRAEAIGFAVSTYSEIVRSPLSDNDDSRSFFNMVEESIVAPRIYRASMDSDNFYLFDTDTISNEYQFEFGSTAFMADDILYAETLEPVEDTELQDAIRSAFTEYNFGRHSANDGEEAKYLKDILEKKSAETE